MPRPDRTVTHRTVSAPLFLATASIVSASMWIREAAAWQTYRIGDIETPRNTLVICPVPLRATMEAWVDYRSEQGFGILVETPGRNPEAIKHQIRAARRVHPVRYLVLVGDVPAPDARSQDTGVPADYLRAQVVCDFGSEPEIATDNTYADLDSDGIADLAVGRLPASTPGELEDLIGKIIRYESAPPGDWQRRINFVAGTGGFGGLADGVIEKASRGMISELIPAEYSVSLTWGDWSSTYCPDPRQFRQTTIDRFNEGCQFWVYMGHGQPDGLDYVRTPVGGYPMLRPDDLKNLDCANGMPVAMMLACYTGAYDLSEDCLSEQLVLHPCGPVAALCSSRVATPYGMSVLALGMIEGYFSHPELETLGDVVLAARQKLVARGEYRHEGPVRALAAEPDTAGGTRIAARHREYRSMVNVLGTTFSPTAGRLAEEAREHVYLFNLLGDPLLKLKRPEPISFSAKMEPGSEKTIVVQGMAPSAGTLHLELELARDRLAHRSQRRGEFDPAPDSLGAYQRIYELSNSRVLARQEIEVGQGEFVARIEVPENARGRCVVRATMACAGEKGLFAGAAPIRIQAE